MDNNNEISVTVNNTEPPTKVGKTLCLSLDYDPIRLAKYQLRAKTVNQ